MGYYRNQCLVNSKDRSELINLLCHDVDKVFVFLFFVFILVKEIFLESIWPWSCSL